MARTQDQLVTREGVRGPEGHGLIESLLHRWQRGRPQHPWAVLVVMCVALVIISLDNTVLTVALPTLDKALHTSESQLEWIMDAYILVYGAMLLIFGRLADRFGRKSVLFGGMALFGAGSLASAFAGSADVLIGTRALMGVGGAAMTPATLAVITDVFPGASERAKAIAIWSGTMGLGVAIGPLVGGILLQHFWWGSVFLINVPIVVAGLLAGAWLVPESREPTVRRPDYLGAVWSIAGLGVLLWGLIEASQAGWGAPSVIGTIVGGAGLIGGFLWWESVTPYALLPLRFYRHRDFSVPSVALALSFFGLFGLMFVITQYLQFVLGESPLAAGIRIMPAAGVILVSAPLADVAVKKVGRRVVMSGGLALVAAGLAWVAAVRVSWGYTDLLPALVMIGLGLGAALAPGTDAVMGSLSQAESGIGSAVNSTTMQIGGALGTAVTGSLLASAYTSTVRIPTSRFKVLGLLPHYVVSLIRGSVGGAVVVGHHVPGPAGAALAQSGRVAFVHAMHVSMPWDAGFAMLAALACLIFLRSRSPG
jgi:EmrB/QacA subfamily drug resistance transporter